MSNKIRINIAHYKEDLSWLQKLEDKGYTLNIYEKNTDLKYYRDFLKINDHQTLLCNIGRESHTYLTHIVHHYDDLFDYEVFLQGKIDDHMDGDIGNHLEKLDGVNHVSWCTTCKQKIGCYSEEVYQKAKENYPSCNHINRFYSPFVEEDYNVFKEIFPNVPIPSEPYHFNAFALFAVKKEIIRYYPKSFYEKLLNYFNPKASSNFLNLPTDIFIIQMGYKLEVLWDFIFKHAVEKSQT